MIPIALAQHPTHSLQFNSFQNIAPLANITCFRNGYKYVLLDFARDLYNLLDIHHTVLCNNKILQIYVSTYVIMCTIGTV